MNFIYECNLSLRWCLRMSNFDLRKCCTNSWPSFEVSLCVADKYFIVSLPTMTRWHDFVIMAKLSSASRGSQSAIVRFKYQILQQSRQQKNARMTKWHDGICIEVKQG